jgi:hypothetical protein
MSDGSDFRVERDVPPPRKAARSPVRYPWPDMKHGDSFVVPVNGQSSRDVQNRVGTAGKSWLAVNKPGWKVTTRKEGKAVRVWILDPAEGAS